MAKRRTKSNSGESREENALLAKIALLRGQHLTRQQERDIAWYDKAEAEKAVQEWCTAMPKGDYCTLAGRQHKLIDDAARLYDLPIGDATINLRYALTALHDLVASNANRIRSVNFDGDRDALEEEKLRQQIAKLVTENDRLQIALDKDRGDAITRQELRQALVAVSASLRDYGRAFARLGPEARDLWNQTCEAIADEIESGRLQF